MRRSVTIFLVLAGLLAGGCGKSDEEKAQDQVCDARADIQKQVNELASVTVDTATVDGITQNIDAIKQDLQKIKDAEGDLSAERKQQVQTATQDFTSDVESVAKNLGKSLSVSGAKSQLESSLNQLADSYRTTLAPIDCS